MATATVTAAAVRDGRVAAAPTTARDCVAAVRKGSGMAVGAVIIISTAAIAATIIAASIIAAIVPGIVPVVSVIVISVPVVSGTAQIDADTRADTATQQQRTYEHQAEGQFGRNVCHTI
jgi:hypothetical protein